MKRARKFRQLSVLLIAIPVVLGALVFLVWGRGKSDGGAEQLVVFSYSSFISPWGPGPELAQKFLEREGVDVKYVDSGDSALIVERLRFQSAKDRVDLVLGLDQLVVPEARRILRWRPLHLRDIQWDEQLPSSARYEDFVPFDWGPLTFVQNGSSHSLKSLEDLLGLRSEIILLDPRTSTPGFQFLYWLVELLGEDQAFDYLQRLRPSIHSVQSSWSTGYNLFQRGEADLIFTYMTSAVFHWVEQQNQEIQPISLEVPLPFQVEYIGIPEKCVKCESAEKFIHFLLEPESQHLIMTKNYMLPVVAKVRDEEQAFDLGPFQLMTSEIDRNLLARKRKLLERWKNLGL